MRLVPRRFPAGAWIALAFVLSLLIGCANLRGGALDGEGRDPLSAESKPATKTTQKAQARTLRALPFEDDRDFELAARGRSVDYPFDRSRRLYGGAAGARFVPGADA